MKLLKGTLLGGLMLALALCAPRALKGQEPKPDEQTIERKAEVDDTDANAVTNNSGAKRRKGIHREAIVKIGQDVELKAGETAEAIVVIGGSAKIHGKVESAAVVIGGDLESDGEINDAVVTVMGNLKLNKGAEVHGNAVAVGGKLETADEVTIHGDSQEVDPLGLGRGLRSWIVHCVLKLRPLAPQVGWIWGIWALFFVIYFLVALVLPKPVQACVGELTRRPVTTFFLGILAKLLVPLVIALLIATGVGVFVVPFAVAALMFGVIVGKVALMEFIGSGIGRRLGINILPLGGFLIGILLITLLYMVPLLGLVTFAVVSVWGLGTAVVATFSGLKREMPERPVASPPPFSPIPSPTTPMSQANLTASATETPSGATEPTPPTAAGPNPAAPMPAVPETIAYPRAGFWERMGAAFLDLLLVGIVGGAIGRGLVAFLLTLAYFVAMWVWKGTTVGGVVLGLKVVRIDGQPITLTVALVRALAGAFSMIVFFLGILWIAIDRDKQGWHDRIAGTVVLRMPKGTPLVCL